MAVMGRSSGHPEFMSGSRILFLGLSFRTFPIDGDLSVAKEEDRSTELPLSIQKWYG